MARDGVPLTTISYNSALETCAKQRDGIFVQARELLKKKVYNDLNHDVISYASVLGARAKRRYGGVLQAKEILRGERSTRAGRE